MNHTNHLIATRRTWKYLSLQENLDHAIYGFCSEIGELISAYKKSVFKQQPVDIVNCVEEIGDALYFIARVVDELQLKTDCLSIVNKGTCIPNTAIIHLLEIFQISHSLAINIINYESDSNDYIEKDISYLIRLYATILKQYNCPIELCRDINIQKLMIRWPDKFDALQDNKDRDLVAEYEDMKARLISAA